jgi:hypothetical protein
MRKLALPFTLLTVAVLSLLTAPAHAQSPRTFVSAAGSDSNPCSFAAPCRHFQAAVNATSPGGEVDALDPAGYGPINITQAITIEGQGWSYIAPPVGGSGIFIDAGTGNVTIHGVSINGAGIAGISGIGVSLVGSLNIRDCLIRNFPSSGLGIDFSSNSAENLFVSNTVISDIGGYGIRIRATGNTTTQASLNRIEVDNSSNAIYVDGSNLGTNGQLFVTVADSLVANHINGISSVSAGATTNVTVKNSTVINSNLGLYAFGSNAYMRLNQSTIAHNAAGWSATGGATLTSYGNNAFDDNSGNGDLAPTVLPLK